MMRRLPGALLIVGTLLAACSPSAMPEGELATAEATAEATSEPEINVSILPGDADVNPPDPITLRIWLPEPLAPVDREDAAELLSELISGFLAQNPGLSIDLRLKRPGDEGGVLETIRSASAVAPDALPDVTLLRRADLVTAAEGGYLEPMQDAAILALLDGMPTAGIHLGRVDDQTFGIPYALDLWHTAYAAELIESTALIDTIAGAGIPFVFPANRPAPAMELLIAQVISADGVFGADGLISIDRNALTRLFSFYAEGARAGWISPNVLTYADPSAYADMLLSQEAIGVVNAHTYQEWVARGSRLAAGELPTLDGTPSTVIDGWVWVMVTGDADRQAAVVRLISWMMEIHRQNEYTELLYFLPSSRSALALREDAVYVALIESLWANATVPLGSGSPAGRALQTALIDVINQGLSAEAAAREVLLLAGSG